MGVKNPCLILIGHSQSGKDETANWLADHTPLRFVHSASWYLAPYCAAQSGLPESVFRGPGRHEYRELMYQTGRRLRDEDAGVLVREQMIDNDIIVGCRDPEEVDYARDQKLVDLVVWIDRDVSVDPTMRRFGPSPHLHADVRLDNTGSLSLLHLRLSRLVSALGVKVTPS